MSPHGTHNALEDPRNEHVLIYVNGELHPRSEAKISVFDSGYLIGDGVWEALRLHEGVLVFLDEHLDRLWQGAATIGMRLPWTREELAAEIRRTLDANGMHDQVHVRFMVTRGVKKTPSQDPRLTVSGPNLVIIPEYKLASPESRERGITLFTSTIRRGSPDYLDPRLNCHSKLHEVMALVQAIEAGADEALMLDVHGFVSTCNATNFFMVKGGEVWTSTGQYCMNGITRGKILKVCRESGILAFEKNFSLFDVYGADEAFVTGTFGGLTPVVRVDGRVIGEGVQGEMTARLRELYKQEIALAVEDLRDRAQREKLLAVLDRAPDVEPEEHDRIDG
jgi:branched-chain amino acid aminotransferase